MEIVDPTWSELRGIVQALPLQKRAPQLLLQGREDEGESDG